MIETFPDWLNLALRLIHVVTAIAWIGSSFYFIWLDLSLKRTDKMSASLQGKNWSVHGGGFYHSQKYLVAPDHMPQELHWFKWESYSTWLSGFALLTATYYVHASSYLIDKNVLDIQAHTAIFISVASLAIGWFIYDFLCKSRLKDNMPILLGVLYGFLAVMTYIYGEVFSARAQFLHVGALIATMMSANVFLVIIPNQKIVVGDLQQGKTPDPDLGKAAKLRSTHNNYLTLPVVFMMLSNHYPVTFSAENNWIIVLLVLIGGAIIRDYFNKKHMGQSGNALLWQWPVVIGIFILLVFFSSLKPPMKEISHDVSGGEVMTIIEKHCVQCHATSPRHENFDAPPQGLVFETTADIIKHMDRVRAQTITSNAMPLGNETGMSNDERLMLDKWLRDKQR